MTVLTQPTGPRQFCTVGGATGTIRAADVTSVNVTCTVAGRFAYVANNGLRDDNNLSAYSINPSTGLLTPIAGSPFDTGAKPMSVAVRPDGKFLYVANPFGQPLIGVLSVFSINDATGALTQLPDSPVGSASTIVQITIEPAGKFALTANHSASAVGVWSLDATTGVPTAVTGSPFACVGSPITTAVDPASKFVFVGTQGGGPNNSGAICSYTLNTTTGALTQVVGSPFFGGQGPVSSLAVDPTGTFLFGTSFNGLAVLRIGATGALTAVTGSPFAAGVNPQSIAIDPAGKFVYVGNDSLGPNARIFGFAVNATTGALTQMAGSPFASSDTPFFITIDPSGNLLYAANIVANTITVYAVNRTTGALTVTGSPIPNGADTDPASIAIAK